MWNWYSGDESSSPAAASDNQSAGTMSVADLTEQLAQTQQLVVQLKDLIREKDNDLRKKDQELKEEKESSDSKVSKAKLQNKARIASLTSQLEDLKKQLTSSGAQVKKVEKKKGSGDGDLENASANRGKILVLRKRVEELESQLSIKNEELQKKDKELEAQRLRGSEMDAILAAKEQKLAEKEAYIVDLQIYAASSVPQAEIKPVTPKDSDQDLQILIQNLTRKVGESEERYSLLQEQGESLKVLLNKEKVQFQEKEAMYTENIRVYQNMILEKEKVMKELAQKHDQEIFKLAAKSDASADLHQLLKALKQKLHEEEEVLLGKNQVIDVLQKELDSKDHQFNEMNEKCRRLLSEKENLQSKLDAEKHVMRAQLKDMIEKHETELRTLGLQHNTALQEIQEKHEGEIQEKFQTIQQLQKQLQGLASPGDIRAGSAETSDAAITKLQGEVKLKTEEASKSEAKFLKMKAWSKSRIRQLEEELKIVQSDGKSQEMSLLNVRVLELEEEKRDLEMKLGSVADLQSINEQLLAKLVVYEEQQRKLQADLEHVAKRADSQTSESGSVDELQNQLLEWNDMSPENDMSLDHEREETSVRALRMAQIEEEREAMDSGQVELEEELSAARGLGKLRPARRKGSRGAAKLQDEFDYNNKSFEEHHLTLESSDSVEGENMGGWWPEYGSPNSGSGLRAVVEELELERNQLQEQIMTLEERCQELGDRLQLQLRIESLQSENERLQTQLSQLRQQQSQEAEKHYELISALNDQLKGLTNRNAFLENAVVEKEQTLRDATAKLDQLGTARKSLQEKEALNKEIFEKLDQCEHQLEEITNKQRLSESENTALKQSNAELTEKVSAFKERVLIQDSSLEKLQVDLDQTNEELDRLNTSHLEERSQLIYDLQRCEREMDVLKELLQEKDKEMSTLSASLTEYSEQVAILKESVDFKDEQMREMSDALVRMERESHLLRESQTLDVQETSDKISSLSEQLCEMDLELQKAKSLNESKLKEAEELIRQISENDVTIKSLRLDIQAQSVSHSNHLKECSVQVALLKEQMKASVATLEESEMKHRKEVDGLRLQLETDHSERERLANLLQEKSSKEQTFENELKMAKEQYNQLVSGMSKKDVEIEQLSNRLSEQNDRCDQLDKELCNKRKELSSLQEKQDTLMKDMEDLGKTLKEKTLEFEKQMNMKMEIINKLGAEKDELQSQIKLLETSLKDKEASLVLQINSVEEFGSKVQGLEDHNRHLRNEKENLLTQVSQKESEISAMDQNLQDFQRKLVETEQQLSEEKKMMSNLLRDQEEKLLTQIELISAQNLQNDCIVTAQLEERAKECLSLKTQLHEEQEVSLKLQTQIQFLEKDLKESRRNDQERADLLKARIVDYNTACDHLKQSQEQNVLLQKQVEELSEAVESKNEALTEKDTLMNTQRAQVEETRVNLEKLQIEERTLKEAKLKMTEHVESLNTALGKLQQEFNYKLEDNATLREKLEISIKEIENLIHERDSTLLSVSNLESQRDTLQTQTLQSHSMAESLTQQLNMLEMERGKLTSNIELLNTTLSSKSEEIGVLSSHLSQQAHTVLSLKDQIDKLELDKQTLMRSVEEKDTLLLQKEELIQQTEMKLEGEGHHLQTILTLQRELQSLVSERTQQQQKMKDQEQEFQKLSQQMQLLKNKSEEAELLKTQLSEHVEIISDLHRQLKTLRDSAEELSGALTHKDECLKEKVDSYLNLKAQFSELQDSLEVQEKQVEALMLDTAKYKDVVSDKDLTIQNSLSELAEIRAKLNSKEGQCNMLIKQLADLEEVNTKQNRDLNELNVSITEQETSHSRKEETLNVQLEQQSKLVSDIQNTVQELSTKNNALEQSVTDKENTVQNLQEKYASLYEHKQELAESLRKREDEVNSLLSSANEKDTKLQVLESNVQSFTNEVNLLREQLDKGTANVKNISEVLKLKDDTITQHQKAAQVLKVDLETVKVEYQEARSQLHALTQEREESKVLIKNLQEQYASQNQHIANLKRDVDHSNSRLFQDQQTIALEKEQFYLQLDSAAQEKLHLEKLLQTLQVERDASFAMLQKQLMEKAEFVKEIEAKLENQVKESEARILSDTEHLKRLKAENTDLQKQVSGQTEEIYALKVNLDNLEHIISELQQQLQNEIQRVNEQNAILREQNSSLDNEINVKANAIQSLLKDLHFVENQLCALCDENVSDCDAFDQQSGYKSKSEKLSSMLFIALDYKAKTAELKEVLEAKSREIKHKSDSILSCEKERDCLQEELKKVKEQMLSKDSVMEELAVVKETTSNQQKILEEKEKVLMEMNTHIELLQEEIRLTKDKLELSNITLNEERTKILELLDEAKKKDSLAQDLSVQLNQQKELISSFEKEREFLQEELKKAKEQMLSKDSVMEELAVVKETTSNQQKILEEKEKVLMEMNTHIELLQEEIRLTKDKLELSNITLNEERTKILELLDEAKKKDSLAQDLSVQLNQQKELISSFEKEREFLQEELKKAKEQMLSKDSVMEELAVVKETTSNQQKILEEKEKVLMGMNTHIELLQEEIRLTKDKLDLSNITLNEERTKILELLDEAKKKDSLAQDLSVQLNQQKELISSFEKEREFLQEELKKAKEQMLSKDSVMEELAVVKETTSNQQKILEEKEKVLMEMNTHIELLQEEIRLTKDKLELSNITLNEERTKILELLDEAKKKDSLAQDLSVQLNQQKELISSFEKEREFLQEELKKAKEQMLSKDSVMEELAVVKETTSNQQKILEEKEKVLMGMNTHIELLQEEIRLTKDKLDLSNITLNEERTKILELLDEAKKKDSLAQDLSVQLNQQKELISSFEKEREFLQEELKKAKEQMLSKDSVMEELAVVKETTSNQQKILEEKEKVLMEMNTHIELLQEEIRLTKDKLELSNITLNEERTKILELLDEAKKKDSLAQDLSVQLNQQKELISTLSNQVKEKDTSLMQAMESMWNEMVTFSEEKNSLQLELQKLQSDKSSCQSQISQLSERLGACEMKLHHSEQILADKETYLSNLTNEKDLQLEKFNKERENLKRKLQAALVIRKDLMQKLEKLEQNKQDELNGEQLKTSELSRTIEDLNGRLESLLSENKELQSCVQLIKRELLDKDEKTSELCTILSEKESLVLELQDKVTELQHSSLEKDSMCQDYIKTIQEKDQNLFQTQNAMNEKLKTLEEENSHLVENLENLKSCLEKAQQLESAVMSLQAPVTVVTPESSCTEGSFSHTENSIVHNNVHASLLCSQGNFKNKEKHASLLQSLSSSVKQFELLQKAHADLQRAYEAKCTEYDQQIEHTHTLQNQIQAQQDRLLQEDMELDNKAHEVEEQKKKNEELQKIKEYEDVVCELKSSIHEKDTHLLRINSEHEQLLSEKQLWQNEMQKLYSDIEQKQEEIDCLKSVVDSRSLEVEQYETMKESMKIDITALQKEVEASRMVNESIQLTIQQLTNEKDAHFKACQENQLEIAQLNHSLESIVLKISEKDKEIAALQNSLQNNIRTSEDDMERMSSDLKGYEEEADRLRADYNQVKRELDEYISKLEKANVEISGLRTELNYSRKEGEIMVQSSSTLLLQSPDLNQVVPETKTVLDNLQGLRDCVPPMCKDCSLKQKAIEDLEGQVMSTSKAMEDLIQDHKRKISEESSVKDQIQRKLQAALVSRKDLLKENKALKLKVESLNLEVDGLSHSLHDIHEKQMSEISPLTDKNKALLSENERLSLVNENLSAACESLKSTMENIVQEKEDFSFQLNSLKDSLMAELTGWKAKHGELNKEYESLLQAYENITDEIDKMRRVIDITKKEKQDVLMKLQDLNSENLELTKQIEEGSEEMDNLRTTLESREVIIQELKLEADRQIEATEKTSQFDEISHQNLQLMEENKSLKDTCENLKVGLESKEKENNSLFVIKTALDKLQTDMNMYKSDMEVKISEMSSENDVLSEKVTELSTKLMDTEQSLTFNEVERCKLMENINSSDVFLKQEQENILKLELDLSDTQLEKSTLSKKVKRLEKDKALLLEEIGTLQDQFCVVKNERENLEMELHKVVNNNGLLSDRFKSLQAQTNVLSQQVEFLRAEKNNIIREKEEHQLQVLRDLEERVKCARDDNRGTKSKSKELQELLKEKQQEINQLHRDSIRFHELILDLEGAIKESNSQNENLKKELDHTSAQLIQTMNEVSLLNEELTDKNNLLEHAKDQIVRLTAEFRSSEVRETIVDKEAEQVDKRHLLPVSTGSDRSPESIVSQKINKHSQDFGETKGRNVVDRTKLEELKSVLQSKEVDLQKLESEKRPIEQISRHPSDDELKALQNILTKKEQELHQLKLESEKFRSDAQKQVTISRHMKQIIDNKDKEISLLISSKAGDLSSYLEQIQTQYRKQAEVNERHLSTAHAQKEKSDLECQRLEKELQSLQVKYEKAINDKDLIASEIEAFRKSMSSLQTNRDQLSSELQSVHQCNETVLKQKDDIITSNSNENSVLKQDLRNVLNQVDDLNAENAMLGAQLIRYREDLNQVLSLKDHQLKELLRQKLDYIKNLEQEKCDLQKQNREIQNTNVTLQKSAEAIELEIQKLTSKVKDQELLIAAINKAKLLVGSGMKNDSKNLSVHRVKDLEEKYNKDFLTLGQDTVSFSNETNKTEEKTDKTCQDLLIQNKELSSQNESFGKAMAALQNNRDSLIDDFKELQWKYASELKNEKTRGDGLERQLDDVKSQLYGVLKNNSLLHDHLLAIENKITLDQLVAEIDSLCNVSTSKGLEVTRLSSECAAYAQQIDAFSKAMASLQHDREQLLHLLKEGTFVRDAKQDASSVKMSQEVTESEYLTMNFSSQPDKVTQVTELINNSAAESLKLKTRVHELERLLQEAKVKQQRLEREVSGFQHELAELRSEKNVLLTEVQSRHQQFDATLAERDRRHTELYKIQETDKLGSNLYGEKGVEKMALVGSPVTETVNTLRGDKGQTQNEVQRYIQELYQRDVIIQQINAKAVESVKMNAVLSAQLKNVSQGLNDTQMKYTDLQSQYYKLQRDFQTAQVTNQNNILTEVPPGAPQERANVLVEIDNAELADLRRRLTEAELHHDATQQELSQLSERLAEERARREEAEEALNLTELHNNRMETKTPSRDYEFSLQMESDDEREALIIDPTQNIVVRKVKGGTLSVRRWLRGRSLYCSKLLTSKSKSRYLFLTYLLGLHILIIMCLTGVL